MSEQKQKLLNKQDFFKVQDITIEPVALPAPYEGVVYVRTMTGEEWDAYQDSILVRDKDGKREVDLKNSRAKMIVQSICDADGVALFTEKDIPELSKRGSKVLEVMAKAAQRLNGVGEDSSKNA